MLDPAIEEMFGLAVAVLIAAEVTAAEMDQGGPEVGGSLDRLPGPVDALGDGGLDAGQVGGCGSLVVIAASRRDEIPRMVRRLPVVIAASRRDEIPRMVRRLPVAIAGGRGEVRAAARRDLAPSPEKPTISRWHGSPILAAVWEAVAEV